MNNIQDLVTFSLKNRVREFRLVNSLTHNSQEQLNYIARRKTFKPKVFFTLESLVVEADELAEANV